MKPTRRRPTSEAITESRTAKRWDADLELSIGKAAGLIDRRFPILCPAQLELFGIGWDNTAYLVNGEYVFRFPRRRVAVPLIEHEIRILPLLAPHLPLPIPVPEFVGAPDDRFPYPFAGYRLIPGITADRAHCSDDDRAANAAALGRFLKALHLIPIDKQTRHGAPGDEIARADIAGRATILKDRIRSAAPTLPGIDSETLLKLVDRLASAPAHASASCWVHGDLYTRHLLVGKGDRLSGVIDWGDVHLGDPALDISIAFSFLPPEARALFREAYGSIHEATWDRSRFRAIHYGISLVEYGSDIGDEDIRAAGEYALRAAAE